MMGVRRHLLAHASVMIGAAFCFMLPMPLSIQIKRLIWEFAGVRSGPQWKVIEAAEVNFRLH